MKKIMRKIMKKIMKTECPAEADLATAWRWRWSARGGGSGWWGWRGWAGSWGPIRAEDCGHVTRLHQSQLTWWPGAASRPWRRGSRRAAARRRPPWPAWTWAGPPSPPPPPLTVPLQMVMMSPCPRNPRCCVMTLSSCGEQVMCRTQVATAPPLSCVTARTPALVRSWTGRQWWSKYYSLYYLVPCECEGDDTTPIKLHFYQ